MCGGNRRHPRRRDICATPNSTVYLSDKYNRRLCRGYRRFLPVLVGRRSRREFAVGTRSVMCSPLPCVIPAKAGIQFRFRYGTPDLQKRSGFPLSRERLLSNVVLASLTLITEASLRVLLVHLQPYGLKLGESSGVFLPERKIQKVPKSAVQPGRRRSRKPQSGLKRRTAGSY